MDPYRTDPRGGDDPRDLAAIVLGDERARRRLQRRPVRMVRPETAVPLPRAYDARSALVLAVVVAAFAGVVGWSTTIERDAPAGQPAAEGAGAATEPSVEPGAADGETSGAGAPAGPEVGPVPRVGVDVAIGRVVAARSGTGSGVVRFAVANSGSAALEGGGGLEVTALLDGQPIGQQRFATVPASGAVTGAIDLGYCPAGRHALVVVADPRGAVAELDERDNATSRMVSFGC